MMKNNFINIQQYYLATAKTSLNGSLVALIPIFVLTLPLSILLTQKEIVLFALPFLLYSVVAYSQHYVHYKRSLHSKPAIAHENDCQNILEKDQWLLTFSPAYSLRMSLFNPDGSLGGEIRDLHNKKYRLFLPYFIDKKLHTTYGLYDASQQLVATFSWSSKKTIEVTAHHGNHLFTVNQDELNPSHWVRKSDLSSVTLFTHALFTDIHFVATNGAKLGRLRKGWMPLTWGEHFIDANTPILTFSEHCKQDDRLFVLLLIIQLYRYHDH